MGKRDLDIVVAGYIINQGNLLLIHHRKLDKWLPVGGHMEENETPDEALRREVMEEVGLEVEFLNYPEPRRGNHQEYALPFYVNVHHITNTHFHYCLFYLCKSKSREVVVNDNELKAHKWLPEEELVFLTPPLNDGDYITCSKAIELGKEL